MPVADASAAARPTLAHVHIEDMRRGVHEHLMFGEGELDLADALGALAEIGYAAWSPSSSRATPMRRTRRSRALWRASAPQSGGGAGDDEGLPPRWRRAPAPRLEWLHETTADRRRRSDRDPLAVPDGRPQGRARAARRRRRPADVHAWTIDDAARMLMLVALGDAAEAELAELYRYGDAAERRGLLRALPYLELGDRASTSSTTRSAPTTRA